jgi:membrane protease YdiL (CAAX protease family)
MSNLPNEPEEKNPTGEDLTIPASAPQTPPPTEPTADESTLTLADTPPTPVAAPPVQSEPLSTRKPTVQEEEGLAPPTKAKPSADAGIFRKRVNFQDILISLGSGVLGGGMVLLVYFLAQLLLQSTFAEMGTNIQYPVEVALIGALAFFVALGLGVWQRILGFVAALVSGLLIALVLFAIWQVRGGNAADPEILEGVNLLLFGFPGILTAVGLSALGGWVGMQVRIAFGAPAALSTPAKVGVGAIGIWAVGELAARIAGAFVIPPPSQAMLLPMVLPIAIAFPIITAISVLVGYRGGVKKEDWDYRWSGVNLAIGGVVGLILFALTFFLTRQLDMGLFSGIATDAAARLDSAIANADMVSRLAYVGIVGLLVPITEEWVWRGIVQTGLTKGMGRVTGVIITALAFVLKYILISLSIGNLVTLLVVAIVLGLVRARAGTAASTMTSIVTHLLTAVILIVT